MVTKYERSWQFDFDRAPSDNSTNLLLSKSALWYWKAFLAGEQGGAGLSLWTVTDASDAVTAASSDLWTSSFDASKIVRAAPGVNHSWVVLQGPNALDLYLTLDYSTGNDYEVDIVFSKAAPTGGTVTNRPTATDEWVYSAAALNNGSNSAYLFHGSLSATGDFLFLHSRTGTARFSLAFMSHRLSDIRPTDVYPAHSFFVHDDANSVLRRTQLNGAGGTWKGRNFDGTAVVESSPPHPATDSTGSNPDSTTVVFEDMGVDATDSKYSDWPMYMYAKTASHKSVRGRLADYRWAPSVLIDGDAEPSSGPIRSMVVGDVWVPADAQPTL